MRNRDGFTLQEILISLSISAVAMTAIYQTYDSMQQSYHIQQEVAHMQQNLRAAMFMMVRDLRMAGYDPTGKAGAGIVTATPASPTIPAIDAVIKFTRDLNGDRDTSDSGEDITYSLYTSGGIQKLGRKNPTLNRPVAEHIEALDFVFLDRDNVQTAAVADIRSVQITLVARTKRADPDYTNNFVYKNKQGKIIFGPVGDGYRRSVLATQVNCRNLGI
jgi:type IV pilus assembly protein PilW